MPQELNDTQNQNTQEKSPGTPGLYVAVGASAGGLEAIEAFFADMNSSSGLAFIVIQHLSPDYKSLMKEILSKKTSMHVHRIEEGMEVLPDNIYLIPPKKNLTIFHGRLFLSEQEHTKGLINLPIDIFLRSLAEDQGEKAVSIILSGSGSDGMRGVRAIKEHGGMVMVQSEDSAKFDSMPRSAISTGLVDFVLPPEEMPGQLVSYAKHPYVAKAEKSDRVISDDDAMTKIFAILRDKYKVDFTHYKPSTLTRRIQRRMTINHISDIHDYVSYMQSYPNEAATLFREFLIGVTRFFRDREAFEALKDNWLQEVLSTRQNNEMRFWIPGCSTGEEAYTLAILARECMEQTGRMRDIKIFATDIDRNALQVAGAGSYPESIAADVPPDLLAKYFYKKKDSFQIARNIREMVVFAQHNLIKDPPFTNIDLISCRNLLIYLQTDLQRKVLEFFNFSLNMRGILFLGTSETTGEMGDYFESLDHKHKIYRTRGRVKNTLGARETLRSSDNVYHMNRERNALPGRNLRGREDLILERFLNVLEEEHIHLAVIVNDHMEVLHVIGNSEGYFKLPSGKQSMDISKMAANDLAIPISTGIQKVLRQNEPLHFSNIRVRYQGDHRMVDMRIKPLPQKKGQDPLVAVFLDESKKQQDKLACQDVDQTYDISREAEQRIHDLEQELQFTRENLQATIEELETANEELQATNEELLASNEELQSTNEELQSTNQELYSVNSEYQNKIIELTELHNDVDNLLSATQIGKLLLDENMEIRRFSPKVTNIFKLLDSDVGRPISHIAHYLQGLDPIEVIENVHKSGEMSEKEARTREGRWYLMRVVPYEVAPEVFSGTVTSFVDITRIKETEAALKTKEALLEQTQRLSRVGGWEMDAATGSITWTDEVYNIYGVSKDYNPSDVEKDMQFYTPEGRDRLQEAFKLALERGSPYDLELPFTKADGTRIWVRTSGLPEKKDGKVVRILGNIMDITQMKEIQQALRESEKYYRNLFSQMPNAFALHEIVLDHDEQPCDYTFLEVNPAFEEMTGLKARDILGRRVLEVLPETEESWIQRYARVALGGPPEDIQDYSLELQKYFKVRVFSPEYKKFAVIFDEIRDTSDISRALRDCEEKLKKLQENSSPGGK
ncbi:chemotaxis protein CheB [Desulfonatronospira sp. MSAO_Bac3]|uniref:chemotaxis protein CheB n=1 Tax=Desulfonatronospira sp. MSAO_Bac3 TaxID=2293857 RepID=UPI000FF558DA|nr:chemotaxis protein CheB [Desulfonatronospira sp. MSAO_Bac3]RQD74551.1 MAG: PAS domain S-box protein [Desulfonatronospira sp. MSAO_Bac3]